VAHVVNRNTPPPCFWQKRLQALESKGTGWGKESQERTRGGNPMKMRDLWLHRCDSPGGGERIPPHPRATQMVIKTKGMRKRQFVRIWKQRADKIEGSRIHTGLLLKGGTKRGHCQQNLGLEITASVTICQVRN